MKLGLVIATRNRPAFASANIRSILSQDGDFVLLVSDNSERAEDRDELEKICSDAGDPRLRHSIRSKVVEAGSDTPPDSSHRGRTPK